MVKKVIIFFALLLIFINVPKDSEAQESPRCFGVNSALMTSVNFHGTSYCKSRWAEAGTVADCGGGECDGTQSLCIKKDSNVVTDDIVLTDIYVSDSNQHISASCGSGWTEVGKVADCGNAICNGVQVICVKTAEAESIAGQSVIGDIIITDFSQRLLSPTCPADWELVGGFANCDNALCYGNQALCVKRDTLCVSETITPVTGCDESQRIMRLYSESDSLGALWNADLNFYDYTKDTKDFSVSPKTGIIYGFNEARDTIINFISGEEILKDERIVHISDITFFASNQRLYIVDDERNAVIEIVVEMPGLPPYILKSGIGAGFLNEPKQIAFGLGRAYIIDSSGNVVVLTNTFGFIETINTNVQNPNGFFYKDNALYISNSDGIYELDLNTKLTADFTPSNKQWTTIERIALSNDNNLLIIDNELFEYDFDGNFINKIGSLIDVCYDEIFGSSYSGISHPETCSSPIVWLSSKKNSPASFSQSEDYNIPVCFDELTCRKIDSGSCASSEKCVVSLSDDSNAKLAVCDNSYDKKICCREKIENAHWRNINGEGISDAVVGDGVVLAIAGGDVGEREISYKIYKDRGFFDDIGSIFSLGADEVVGEFSSTGFGEWITKEIGEFYFEASLDSIKISSKKNENGILNVAEEIEPPVTDCLDTGCAEGFECLDVDGVMECVQSGDADVCDIKPVEDCSDYNTDNFGSDASSFCVSDECDVSGETGDLEPEEIYSCLTLETTTPKFEKNCRWGNNKCYEDKTITFSVTGKSVEGVCQEEISKGVCEDDERDVTITREWGGWIGDEPSWLSTDAIANCQNELCPEKEIKIVKCPRPVLKLSFFNWINLIIACFILGIFYFRKMLHR